MSDLKDVILFALDQTSRIAKLHSQREFDLLGLGINVDQWLLLKIIEEKETLSQNELAHESRRDPASITRSLDLLQKKGLLSRTPVLENRRQYAIQLTKEGHSFVVKHMRLVNKLRVKSTKGLSKNECQELLSMLHRIQENMH